MQACLLVYAVLYCSLGAAFPLRPNSQTSLIIAFLKSISEVSVPFSELFLLLLADKKSRVALR